jgi:hypothetical protein
MIPKPTRSAPHDCPTEVRKWLGTYVKRHFTAKLTRFNLTTLVTDTKIIYGGVNDAFFCAWQQLKPDGQAQKKNQNYTAINTTPRPPTRRVKEWSPTEGMIMCTLVGLSHTSYSGDGWVWSNSGMMISTGKPKVSKKNALQCHFVHHVPHLTPAGTDKVSATFWDQQYYYICFPRLR